MRVTVLGKSPAWQDAGGACSGYLVEHDGVALVVDCGNGVFAKLREHTDYTDVDAVAITHMHADHFFDLFPFSYGLLLTPRQQPVPVAGWPGTPDPARPRLIAPVGAPAALRSIASVWGDEALVESAFRIEEYDGATPVEVGPLHAALRGGPALHPHLRDRGQRPATASGSPSAPTAAPTTSSSSSRRTPTCW